MQFRCENLPGLTGLPLKWRRCPCGDGCGTVLGHMGGRRLLPRRSLLLLGFVAAMRKLGRSSLAHNISCRLRRNAAALCPSQTLRCGCSAALRCGRASSCWCVDCGTACLRNAPGAVPPLPNDGGRQRPLHLAAEPSSIANAAARRLRGPQACRHCSRSRSCAATAACWSGGRCCGSNCCCCSGGGSGGGRCGRDCCGSAGH